ncbi:MAG: Gfo/Idh/MocA family oxidoreductase [Spirochaetaceae bacterium]|nr:Gfo/Idh/MocA family oxidoreductase [Spirochaetaceae bacterium]
MKKVITYGSFDLFHEGHYNILKRAKELGDYLIVGVTTEQYDETRGKLNIVDSLAERIENVRKTGFADEIIVEDHLGQKVEDIQKHNIDIFTVGSDWEGKFDFLKEYCDVVYLPRTQNVSSTLLRQNGHPIIRVGIIGTGRIATRFMRESHFVSGCTINCIYNPNVQSAENFAKSFEVGIYTDNFDKFLEQIDAVYIASPHGTHYEYAKKCLENKKHVLSEKPLVFFKDRAVELYDLAKKNKCVLLEAIKTAYCPGFNQLLGLARSGIIGSIRDVEATFTRLTNPDGREQCDEIYGGGFTEYGTYTLLPIIKLLGKDFEDVQFSSILAENGVDLYTKVYFKYKNGLALAKTGVGVKSEGQLVIAGTKGYILAPSPWWLTKEFEVHYEDPSKIDKYATTFLGDGLRYELSDFIYSINGYGSREYKLTSGESIAMAEVYEKFLSHREKFVAKYGDNA